MAINNVSVSGNIAAEPKLFDKGETAVLRFPVAVNDRVKNAQGEWENRPNFFDCVVFGARAKGLNQWLAKGMKVAVSGKLRQSKWEDKEGNKRYSVEITAYEVDAMPPAKKEQPAKQESQGGYPYDDCPF